MRNRENMRICGTGHFLSRAQFPPSFRVRRFRLLTPALSSFEEERENYFVGRLPGVVALPPSSDFGATSQPRANFRCAFSASQSAHSRQWTRSRPLARPCGPSASPNSFRRLPNRSSRAIRVRTVLVCVPSVLLRPKKSVSIGVHPWLQFFAPPHLSADSCQSRRTECYWHRQNEKP